MQFQNVRVRRIAIHEVFQRGEDRLMVPPACSNELEELSQEALIAFQLRMTDALSGQSQSLQMRVVTHGADSFIATANDMVGADDARFLVGSKIIATKLAQAQLYRRIPGGMVVVFDGTTGAPAVPFVGVIKAETQAGFRRSRAGERVITEFLNNIFLTPATKLYKIGVMLQTDPALGVPEGWKAFIFDSNISQSHRESAASYFYEGFLGCAMPNDGPYETMRFFDLTKEFVRRADIEPERKRDLIDSLHVFVRDEQTPTFTAEQFSDRYLPDDLKDAFTNYLDVKKFTPNAVVRDTSAMGNRLRRRKLRFGTEIELSASPEALADKVKIETFEAEEADGVRPTWTRIIIRERLTGEQ